MERREVLRASRRRHGERRAQRLPASRRARRDRVASPRRVRATRMIFRLLHTPRVIGVLEHRGDALGERVHGAHAQDRRQAPHGGVDLSTELVQAEPRRRRVGLVRRVRLGDAPRVILPTPSPLPSRVGTSKSSTTPPSRVSRATPARSSGLRGSVDASGCTAIPLSMVSPPSRAPRAHRWRTR